MTHCKTALAAITTLLLTGYAAVVIAKEQQTDAGHVVATRAITSTARAVPRTYVCDISCRLNRRMNKKPGSTDVKKADAPYLPSSDIPVMQSTEPDNTGILDPTVASGAKAIWIYLGAQEAFLTEYGIVVKTYQISSGAPATPTPRGEFQIYKKEDLRVSGQAVPYRMPKYMSFTRNSAFGLHSLPYLGASSESSGYWSEALSHIGTPVSHGCVRFLPEEATEIYEWADIGIPVFIQS
ncbi:MAG: L,D-transpeptidase [Candidatus Peribacter sp.]|nr:L,D-transpeptidase [Candidatus Peribacter sp.]